MKRRKRTKVNLHERYTQNFFVGVLVLVIVVTLLQLFSPLGFFSQQAHVKDQTWVVDCQEQVNKVAYDFVSEIADGVYHCSLDHFCERLVAGEILPGNNQAQIDCDEGFTARLLTACQDFSFKICHK